MSTDQRYLYDIVHAVQNGKLTESLKAKVPGPIFLARWLTLACRILRIYVTIRKPSKSLRILAQFVVKVYAPMWFNVKMRPNVCYGSQHFFAYLKSVENMKMPKKTKDIVLAVIEHNAYFGHPEQVLLSMLCDEDEQRREKAVSIILKIRESPQDSIREMKMPKLNYSARSYDEMISFENEISEPPITMHLINTDLLKCRELRENHKRNDWCHAEPQPSSGEGCERRQ